MIVLARAADGIDSETGRADPAVYTVRLKSIRISDVRVSGQIDCGRADAVHCAARFSAPLFVE
jgi:hypothetical protein